MAEPYYTLYFNWIEDTQELNDQEKGRLIDAIVLYARGDDWQERIKGNERYVFPIYKNQLDRARRLSEVRAEAGAKGGNQNQTRNSKVKQSEASRSKTKQIEANDSKVKQSENESSKIPNIKEEDKEEYKEKDIYEEEEEEERARARLIDTDWKMVADAYQREIGMLPMGTALDVLTSYVDDLGGDVVCKAIEITNAKTPDNPHQFLVAILKNFEKNGIDSREKAEAYLKDRERRIANDSRGRAQVRGAYQTAEIVRGSRTATGNADGEGGETLSPSERSIRESFDEYLRSTHI